MTLAFCWPFGDSYGFCFRVAHAFAVALGVGTTRQDIWFRPGFRLSFHFGLFQFMMPILGWLGGATLARFIAAWDRWIAYCHQH